MEDDPILTTREAAVLLGVSVRTVQTWVEEGAIDSWKTPGGHRRLRKSAVAALRARRVVQPVQTAYPVLVIASEATARRCSESLAALPSVRMSVINDALLGLIEAGHQAPAAVVLEVNRLDWERLALLKRLLTSPRLAHARIVALSELSEKEMRFDLGETRIAVLGKDAAPADLRAAIAPYQKPVSNSVLTYPTPANEAERLQAVTRAQLDNSVQQNEFDEIVAMAADVLKTPIGLITLLTAEQQWFKARYGLDVQDTPRDLAFCNYTILQQSVFVVEDASADERFSSNPLVTGEPGIQFYAGAPIVDYEGFPLGALCIIDRKPRALKLTQRSMVQTLATLVSDKINLSIRDRQLRRARDE
jgi:excisionase family DNA binding protein